MRDHKVKLAVLADSYVAPLVINDAAPNIIQEEHIPLGELAGEYS